MPKVLGELSLNAASTTEHAQEGKSAAVGKENNAYPGRPGTPSPGGQEDLDQELFGTPPRCPSTPPPKASSGPFKTPTRPTPSHRPITRSISRSIRSSRSTLKSPAQLFGHHHLQRTPSRTPRSSAGLLHPSSASKRRSPRSGGNTHQAHFAMDESSEHSGQLSIGMAMHMAMPYDSPFTATLHQLLSEANDFIGGSPCRISLPQSHQEHHHRQLDLGLQDLDGEGGHSSAADGLDFGSFLSTDMAMPSSPPLLRRRNRVESFGGTLEQESVWAQQLSNSLKGRDE